MDRTLILHIGLHKTGSSAIQAALARHGRALARHGVGVSRLGRNPSLVLITAFAEPGRAAHGNRHRGLTDPGALARASARARARIERDFAAAACPVHVLSAEGLAHLGAGGVDALAALAARWFSHVRVIGYVRPPRAHVTSAIQEVVKQGQDARFITAHPPLPQYRFSIAPYLTRFGREQTRLTLYGPGLDVVGDLFGQLGLAGLGTARARPVNVGLPLRAVRLLLALNARHPSGTAPPYGRVLAGRLARLGGPGFGVPAAFLDDLMAQPDQRQDVDWMARMLGADLTEPDIPPAPDGLTPLTEAEVTALLGPTGRLRVAALRAAIAARKALRR